MEMLSEKRDLPMWLSKGQQVKRVESSHRGEKRCKSWKQRDVSVKAEVRMMALLDGRRPGQGLMEPAGAGRGKETD